MVCVLNWHGWSYGGTSPFVPKRQSCAVLGWWVGEQVNDQSGRRHILGGEIVIL